MSSITVRVTKAVLEKIREIVPNAEYHRSYYPKVETVDLEAAGRPWLCVVPMDREVERATSGGARSNTITVDIGVRAKLKHIGDPTALAEEIDPLMEIAERIHDAFLMKIVLDADGLKIACTDPEHVVFHSPEEIEENHCFLSVIRITTQMLDASKT